MMGGQNATTALVFTTHPIIQHINNTHHHHQQQQQQQQQHEALTHHHLQQQQQLVSDDVAFVFQTIFMVILGIVISIVGIIANIVNIVVFIKQGAYKECGSVNLLGLAVSDLCVAVSMFASSVLYAFVIINPPNLPWIPFHLFYMIGGFSYFLTAQISRSITAFVAFERCICVVLPFKVKSILTPNRSIVIIVSIFVCITLSYSPAVISYRLTFKLDPFTNRSRLVFVVSTAVNARLLLNVMWYMTSLTFNFVSVIVVFICTFVTVYGINLSRTWRVSMSVNNNSTSINKGRSKSKPIKATPDKDSPTSTHAWTISSAADPKQENNNSTTSATTHTPTPTSAASVHQPNAKIQKEARLVAMIVCISVIFLICFLPDLCYLLMNFFNSEIVPTGRESNLSSVMYSTTFFFGTFNSSINIAVYYRMSSKYRQIFRQLFGLAN